MPAEWHHTFPAAQSFNESVIPVKCITERRGQVWLCFSEVKHLFGRKCSAPQNMLWFAGESDWRAARLVDFEMKRSPVVTQLGNAISTSCFRNISVASNTPTVSLWTERYHSICYSVVTLLHFCFTVIPDHEIHLYMDLIRLFLFSRQCSDCPVPPSSYFFFFIGL